MIVRETPPRLHSNAYSEQRSSLNSTERTVPFSSSPVSSAFRLQPRGKFATPSPSARGRKRNSQCLADANSTSTQSCSPTSRSVWPTGTEEAIYSPASSHAFRQESHEGVQPIWETPLSRTDMAMKHCSPGRVESALQTLSIKSPRITRSPEGSQGSPFTTSVAGRPGSSFIMYSSSPLGSSFTRPQTDCSGSGVCTSKVFGSPSSTRSSPKLAPLRVLSNPVEGTPTHRPPLHGRPSSLLISLDTAQSMKNDDVDLAHKEFLSGKQLDCSEQGKHCHVATYSSPQRSDDKSSPSRRSHCSPGTLSSRKSSPRTPLPRVKLTPKSHSSRDSAECVAHDLRLLPNEFVFKRSSRPPLFISGRKHQSEESPTTCLRQSKESCQYPEPMSPASPPPRKRSYLPIPEWGENVRKAPTRSSAMDTHSTATPEATENVPAIETFSLLTPSRSGSLLAQMMYEDSRAASMDDDGSLTDNDDNEAFVLTNPAILVEEQRKVQGRARQRQRLSFHSLDHSAACQSSASLALSTQTSNASLLGMAYMTQGDSSASLKSPEMAPVPSLQYFSRKREHAPSDLSRVSAADHKSFTDLRRQGSENSLHSVGLALDDPEAGRDLTTPPAIATTCSSPPLLSLGEEKSQCTPSSSVYLSRSDPDAVNMTISRMVFHANQHGSPKMKCS